jgi:uncharacterized membrane protein
MRVEQSIEVEVPVQKAYNQWTQFEAFPSFMEDVKQVRQLGDSRLHWVAEIAGTRKEWDARITRQVPDEVIAWESEGGTKNDGTVVFTPLDGGRRTKIDLYMDYETDGVKEAVGSVAGVPSRAVGGDLERFKEFIENRGTETGAWRGQVAHGRADDPGAGSRPESFGR